MMATTIINSSRVKPALHFFPCIEIPSWAPRLKPFMPCLGCLSGYCVEQVDNKRKISFAPMVPGFILSKTLASKWYPPMDLKQGMTG
jgi:hypothetical protein